MKTEIDKELYRLDLFLANTRYGFLLAETNSQFIKKSIMQKIGKTRNPLYVDFSSDGIEVYNRNVLTGSYDAVIFFNVEKSGKPFEIIESFNLNRDNFLQNKMLYMFILPQELANYVMRETTNLYSYVIAHFILNQKFSNPFRPLMSMDNFVVDKELIRNAKSLVRYVSLEDPITCLDDVIERVNYFKYVSITEKELFDLVEALESFVNAEKYNTKIVADLLLDINWIVLQRHDYALVEDLCIALLLSEFMNGGETKFSLFNNKLLPEEKRQRDAKLSGSISKQYAEGAGADYFSQTQVIRILRLLATSVFYQKQYSRALQWLLVAKTVADTNERDEQDVKILLCNDIAVCYFKLGNSYPWRKWFRDAEKIHSLGKSRLETKFVIDYNSLVYKILANDMLKEDYEMAKERAEFYREAVTEKSSIFSSYLTLVAWARGCIAGNISEGLVLCKKSLEIKRKVFTENHYSIAESHYCNAVLYRLEGKLDSALYCAKKAANILRVNSEENHTLLKIVDSFVADLNEGVSNGVI